MLHPLMSGDPTPKKRHREEAWLGEESEKIRDQCFGQKSLWLGNWRSEEQPLGKLQEGRVEHFGAVGDID